MNDLVSILGYADGSPFRSNPYLDINTPEGVISMENTSIPLMGTDNLGNTRLMKPGKKYKFPGNQVRERPMKQAGGIQNELYDFLLGDDPQIPTSEGDSEDTNEDVNNREESGDYENNLAMEQLHDDVFPTYQGAPSQYYPSQPSVAANNPYKNTTKVTGNKANYAFEFFKNKGLSPQVAAGIVGNLMQESGNFRDDVIAGTRKGDSGLGFGIAQWHPDRQAGLMDWAKSTGVNPYTFDAQLEYVYREANQRGDISSITAKDAGEAAKQFAQRYERPKIIDPNRVNYAKSLYPYKQGGTLNYTIWE